MSNRDYRVPYTTRSSPSLPTVLELGLSSPIAISRLKVNGTEEHSCPSQRPNVQSSRNPKAFSERGENATFHNIYNKRLGMFREGACGFMAGINEAKSWRLRSAAKSPFQPPRHREQAMERKKRREQAWEPCFSVLLRASK